jgi:hypothetical protein
MFNIYTFSQLSKIYSHRGKYRAPFEKPLFIYYLSYGSNIFLRLSVCMLMTMISFAFLEGETLL